MVDDLIDNTLVMIEDPDEATAILNGSKTHDQAGNPQHSPGAKGPKTPQEQWDRSTLRELPILRNSGTGSYDTPANSPPDEWTTVVTNNKKEGIQIELTCNAKLFSS